MYVEKLDLFSVLFFSLFRDFMQMAGRKNTWDSVSYQQHAGYESFLFNLEFHIRIYYLAACGHFRASIFIDIIHSYFPMGGGIHSFSAKHHQNLCLAERVLILRIQRHSLSSSVWKCYSLSRSRNSRQSVQSTRNTGSKAAKN